MYIQDPLMLAFLASLFFLTGLFMYGFYYILKKQWDINRREHELDERVLHEIKDAHIKAQAILSEAAEHAKSILTETHVFKERTEKDIAMAIELETNQYRKLLDSKLQKVIGEYEKIFSRTGDVYAQTIKSFHDRMIQAQEEQAQKFHQTLDDESLNSKFYLQRKVNEEMKEAKLQIEQFKVQEQQRVAQALKQLMKKLALESFEGELSSEQQEKIIFKALEKAKDQHLFDT